MVKVKYVGPGSDNEKKRAMEVSDAEADRLEKRGLWKRVGQRKKEVVTDG